MIFLNFKNPFSVTLITFICKLVPRFQSKSFLFLKPFPKQQILDSSKLKEFADDNFKFDKNGKKFSRQVENSAGKEEIACYDFRLGPAKASNLVQSNILPLRKEIESSAAILFQLA